jgi:hypothetical protein
MFKSGKWVVVMLLLGSAVSPGVFAATSDTFTITVTCNFMGINLRTYNDGGDYTTWAIGQQNTSASVTMIENQGIMVANTSNIATDVSAWVTTTGAWTAAGSAGPDQYKLELKAYDATETSPDLGTGSTTITATASTGDEFKTGLAAGISQWVYCKFTVPASTTVGTQQTLTVTLLVSAAS